MSTKSGKIGRHKFNGDPKRFEVLADFIDDKFHGNVKRIADVGGGQGMLSRILKKRYNFESEVIDPRGFALVGVENRKEEYSADMADFYDLIIGLHPDEALKEVVLSALIRPIIVIPCCNFWDSSQSLGRDELIIEIENFFKKNNVKYEKVVFDFSGPKNIGLVTHPQI